MGFLQLNPKGTQRIAVEVVFLVLDIVVLAMRLWSRKLKQRPFEFNDFAIIAAVVSRSQPLGPYRGKH